MKYRTGQANSGIVMVMGWFIPACHDLTIKSHASVKNRALLQAKTASTSSMMEANRLGSHGPRSGCLVLVADTVILQLLAMGSFGLLLNLKPSRDTSRSPCNGVDLMKRATCFVVTLLMTPLCAWADIAPWPKERSFIEKMSEENQQMLVIAGVLLALGIATVGLVCVRRNRSRIRVDQPIDENQA